MTAHILLDTALGIGCLLGAWYVMAKGWRR